MELTKSKAERSTWQYYCQCGAICILLSLLLNTRPLTAQAADPELAALQNSELAIDQNSDISPATDNTILSLNDEQLRYLKFFLAGGILTLLIVLICGLLRSSSTVHTAQSQVYSYPPPPQHFIPPTPPFCYPPAPPTAAQPAKPEVEANSQNAAFSPVPHGMYYPSIPLSLSMPVAWPQPYHAAPAPLAETTDQIKASPAQAQAQATRSQPVDETRNTNASIPNRTDTHAAAEDEPGSPNAQISQNTNQNEALNQDAVTDSHNTMGATEEAHSKTNLSPILGEILKHTQHLKNLA